MQTHGFLDKLQKIDGCSYVDVNDIKSWLEANNRGYRTTTDQEIIASRLSKDTESTEGTDVDNDEQPQL